VDENINLHLTKTEYGGKRQIPMSGEFARKVIHLCSLSIPIGYTYLPYSTTLWILVPVTLFAIFVDYGRYYIKWLKKLVNKLLGPILREHERDSSRKLLSGGSYVLISACLCIVIFPKIIAITAFSILIISDAASALIGRRFGKHHFLDKSLEGTLAFIISACIVVLVTPKVSGIWEEYFIGFGGALIGGIFEAMSVRLRVDDNFSVPISIGIIMWLGYYLFSLFQPAIFEQVYRMLVK
jgi:dolichol kinase